MASFICHVVGGTKRVRLERIVMRRLYQTAVAATSLLLPSESPVLRAPTLRPDPQALPRLLDGRPARPGRHPIMRPLNPGCCRSARLAAKLSRSEEHTSELQSLMRTSYAVFCLKKKKHKHKSTTRNHK